MAPNHPAFHPLLFILPTRDGELEAHFFDDDDDDEPLAAAAIKTSKPKTAKIAMNGSVSSPLLREAN